MLNYIFTVSILVFFLSVASADEETSVYYQRGVDSHSLGERESNFEKALKLYMNQQIKNKENGIQNGYLYYNIGNCYFNLNQLGEAILYYKQALKLCPHEEKILQNYSIAMAKRITPIDIDAVGKLSETLLFFHYFLTDKNKILIMFILSIVILLVFINFLKFKKKIFKNFGIFFTLIYILFLLSLFVNYYYPQKEGVFIKDSFVYQDAGENYASLVTLPITKGSSIRVLMGKGGWYKVSLNDGRTGFVKESSLSLVL